MNGIVNLNTRVSELLNRMGVPDYTAGYSFLHTAIMSVYEQPDLLGSIIKCLYVVVANKHKTTVAHVEEELEHVLLATYYPEIVSCCRRYCIPALQTADIDGNS